MGAITNISLADAQATPVTHVFNPSKQGLQGSVSVADWEDRAVNNGVPVGFYKISTTFQRPNKDRKSYKIGMKISIPQLENVTNSTVSGIAPAPTVSYTPLFEGSFVLPERASLQSRKDLRKMVANLFADPQIANMVEQLDAVY